MWIPFFKEEDNWNRYRKEVLSWEGTPYRHLKMTKGKGADCTLFIGATWLSMGILTNVKYDYYPRDWHLNKENISEFVLNSLHYHWSNFSVEGVEILSLDTRCEKDFTRGDVLCFSTTELGVTNHAVIWFGKFPETKQKRQFYHSINEKGVCRMTYGSFWKSRLKRVFRIMMEI